MSEALAATDTDHSNICIRKQARLKAAIAEPSEILPYKRAGPVFFKPCPRALFTFGSMP